MTDEKKQPVFVNLRSIDCKEHIEQKNGLNYLSWAWAWDAVKKEYPDATYEIYKDENMRPYVIGDDLGIMCYTKVTIEGQTLEMWLPVMNSANVALKTVPYKIVRFNKFKKANEEVTIEPATMFDVNKTIMRCLVKNLAMFGLGLYIYAGEDLPEQLPEDEAPIIEPKKRETHKKVAEPAAQPAPQEAPKSAPQSVQTSQPSNLPQEGTNASQIAEKVIGKLSACNSVPEVLAILNTQEYKFVANYPSVIAVVNERREKLCKK